VDPVQIEALDDTDATADGFDTAGEMRRLLHELYPSHLTDDKQWFRVRFRLHELHRPRASRDEGQRTLF
jgi:hypothetical protein